MENLSIIEITGLSKSFHGRTILDSISLTLNRRENLVVLGKSGTGKTVLLKCIAGLLKPEAGEVKIFGQDIMNCPESKLNAIRTKIGYVFQQGALYDSISVKENMLFPLLRNPDFSKMPPSEMNLRVETNLRNVGLLDSMNNMPGEMSGGMKKRAGLARALMLSPEIMLYDEPTAGLDPFMAQEISELIVSIQHKNGTASVVVTHDMKCAGIVADRICVLHDGQFIAEGDFQGLAGTKDQRVSMFFKT